MRGLYAFNQYIYAIIVAYFIFWLVWKTENIPVSKKDWIVGVICLLCSLLTYISPIKLFFIWPTESIGFIYGLILYHHKKSIINQLENNRFIKIIALFLLSAILGVYKISNEMGMEFATASLHNSFYFVEAKNIIKDRPMVAKNFENLVNELLRSNSPKKWFRAYFNHGLINYIYGQKRLLPCDMSFDTFFIDPYGTVSDISRYLWK